MPKKLLFQVHIVIPLVVVHQMKHEETAMQPLVATVMVLI